jgi:hypothetical protein
MTSDLIRKHCAGIALSENTGSCRQLQAAG